MAKTKITPLEEGAKAPAFNLPDKDGEKHRLSALLKEYDFVVLFFYPKDNTPGCTVEAKGFSSLNKKFEDLNTAIVGISGGDEKSKTKFCSKHKLKELMLSDTDFAIAKKYGVYGEKKFMGRTFDGIHRMTFIVNSKQKVVKSYTKVKPPSHPKEVLADIESLA